MKKLSTMLALLCAPLPALAATITAWQPGGDLASSTTATNQQLANTAVTAGVYNLANMTVDSKGRITFASTSTYPNIVALWSGTCTASASRYLATDGTCQLLVGGGTVTSVGIAAPAIFTISGSPVTNSGTLTLTANGTSGGIPYFNAANTMASSAALTANRLVLGGGAGAAPSVLGSLGTTTTVLHGNAAGAPTFGAVSLTTDITGNLPVANLNSGTSASATTLWHGNATWAAVSLTTDVTGRLPYANLVQGSALSVAGVTGNATADYASIAAASDNQVLRRSGTALAFGAVNLASSAAVTGTLADANLSSNVALKNIDNLFSAQQSITTAGGAYLTLNGNGTGAGSGIYIGDDSGSFLWQRKNQPFLFGTNNVERMRILATGGVTIATPSSSGVALSVAPVDNQTGILQNLASATNGFSAITAQHAGVTRGQLGTGPATLSGAALGDFSLVANTGTLRLGVGTTTAIAIAAAGNVTINAPSSGNTLTLTGATGAVALRADEGSVQSFFQPSSGTSELATGTLSAHSIGFYVNGAKRMALASGGGLGVGTPGSGTDGEIRATNNITAYYSSDRRLKENVVAIPDALHKIEQIRGVTFDWTDEYIKSHGGEDGYFMRKHDVGVIAQEIEAVLPEVVATQDTGYKAVKYDRIVALLIEGIKDLKAQNDDLYERVKVLEAAR